MLLKKGDRGPQVKELQELLGLVADGVFGSGTEASVRKFQVLNGLSVDGMVGNDTYTKLVSNKSRVAIKRGDRGDNVKELQKMLGLRADGIFGGGTEAAVKSFQSSVGLISNGIVNAATFNKLKNQFAESTAETDLSNFDDSGDTDDKLNYLGAYKTAGGLEIDRAYLDSDEYVKDYGKIDPEYFFIHHTAGWNNPYNVVNAWNKDRLGRVGTQYCIGGINIKTADATYDGKVVECFPNNYLAWHLGKGVDITMSKFSAGVEINNFGYVTQKGGKFYNYVNGEVPANMVCDLGFKFRGHQYWHAYTSKQLASLKQLFLHVKNVYPKINLSAGLPQLLRDGVHPGQAFGFNNAACKGKIKGLWTHTNVRKDKFDCFPQKELVELLKTL